MASEAELKQRCADKCELCSSANALSAYQVPDSEGRGDADVMLCSTCIESIQSSVEEMNINHWRCLSDSMWSSVPAVQILAWRILKRISAESWAG